MTKAERRAARQQFGSQVAVAQLLGIGRRSLIRYEQARKAPRWYELALLGLSAGIELSSLKRRLGWANMMRDKHHRQDRRSQAELEALRAAKKPGD